MATHPQQPQARDPIAEAVREINRCGGAILTLSVLVGDGQAALPARDVGGVSDLLHIVGEAVFAATEKLEQIIERGGRP